jgi:F0F1-type ATP synthase assembly protein I
VPLVVLLGVALPLLIVGGVMAVVLASLLGVGALLGSPLILLGLLVFVVLRNRSRANAAVKSTPV